MSIWTFFKKIVSLSIILHLLCGAFDPVKAGPKRRNATQQERKKKEPKEASQPIPTEESPTCPFFKIPPPDPSQATHVYMIDAQTGRVLLQKRHEEPMNPSSMTKILTAYMIFDALDKQSIQPDTLFSVSQNAWRKEGSSMFLNLAQQVSVADLLRGALVLSGNDACIVLAEGLKGTELAFAEEMNKKAKELGAKNTHFINASGLPDANHYTTAYDLALFAEKTLHDFPHYYTLYAEKEFTYNNIKQGNRNPLLYKNIGCDGVKTGHSQVAGYGMVASCLQGDRRLILVINGLSSPQMRSDEAMKLLNYGFATFNNYTLFKKDDVIDQIVVFHGDDNELPVTVSSNAVLCIPRSLRPQIKIKMLLPRSLNGPIQKGDRIGSLRVENPSFEAPIEFPLVAAQSIGHAHLFKRVLDSLKVLVWGE